MLAFAASILSATHDKMYFICNAKAQKQSADLGMLETQAVHHATK